MNIKIPSAQQGQASAPVGGICTKQAPGLRFPWLSSCKRISWPGLPG